MSSTIDLNADLGEGFGRWSLGDDAGLLEIVTSANVACGFHAGDPAILRRACTQAAERGVTIGAQVSYRDLAGFGRRFIDMDPAELVDDVIYQIGALDGFARVAGSRVRYVKPHGALYNAVVSHEEQASAVVEAVRLYDATLPILGMPDSAVLRLAIAAGIPVVNEAFADRAYTPDGRLVPRRSPGAVLDDAELIASRCVQLVRTGGLPAVDGTTVEVRARSLCVHGDTAGAVEIARRVRAALEQAGVSVRPFLADSPAGG